MGFYRKFVLPHLINWAMSNKETMQRRSPMIGKAAGRVLEVGIGSGLNLPFYSIHVQQVFGLDPSEKLLEMARKKARVTPFPVELVNASAEELPFESEMFDTAVITWTLCSIPSAMGALQEMKRVLKSHGTLIFIEHGASPDPRVIVWQERMNPIWRSVAGGCNLNRKIDDLIRAAGFRLVELEMNYLPGPRAFTYTYQGVAQKIPTHESVRSDEMIEH